MNRAICKSKMHFDEGSNSKGSQAHHPSAFSVLFERDGYYNGGMYCLA